jgi:hemerythrin-like domain-containing protein
MKPSERRQFLVYTVAAGLGISACSGSQRQVHTPAEGDEQDVSPPEDLMREHGVLNRILLVYEESAHRLRERQTLPLEVLAQSAQIVRTFIEGYHEKLEEDHVFPRFEKLGKLVELVATLRRQHVGGRRLTERILQLCTTDNVAKVPERGQLVESLEDFVRMYRPHEAREDTVLFPALRSVTSKGEFEELGERFEDQEHALFGKQGFEGIVQRVETIERALGIFELDRFTP